MIWIRRRFLHPQQEFFSRNTRQLWPRPFPQLWGCLPCRELGKYLVGSLTNSSLHFIFFFKQMSSVSWAVTPGEDAEMQVTMTHLSLCTWHLNSRLGTWIHAPSILTLVKTGIITTNHLYCTAGTRILKGTKDQENCTKAGTEQGRTDQGKHLATEKCALPWVRKKKVM